MRNSRMCHAANITFQSTTNRRSVCLITGARQALPLREVIVSKPADAHAQKDIAATVEDDPSAFSRSRQRRPGTDAARPCPARAHSHQHLSEAW